MKVLILAAGRSNRFFEGDTPVNGAERTKLLEKFFGVPLIQHVVDRALELNVQGTVSHIVLAVSDDTVGTALEEAITSAPQNRTALDTGILSFCRVPPHDPGSAFTVSGGIRSLVARTGPIMLLVGDVPLVSPDDLTGLAGAFNRRPKSLAGVLLGVRRPDPDQYGRLESVHTSHGQVVKRVVDFRHLARMKAVTRARARANTLVNAGVMIIELRHLRRAVRTLVAERGGPHGAGPTIGDIVQVLYDDGHPLLIHETLDYLGTTGIDTPIDLARLEAMVSNAQSSSIRRDEVEASTRLRVQAKLEEALLEALHLSTTETVSQSGVDGYVLSLPRGAKIGGDFYATEILERGRSAYLLGDGRGHGIYGAMQMLPVLSGFRMCFKSTLSTKHVVHQLNDLCNTMTIQASAIYIILERPDSGGRRRIFGSLAGHPAAIVLRSDGTDSDFPDDDANLGLLGTSMDLGVGEGKDFLAPGDMLVACTDGIFEATPPNEPENQFGRREIVHAALQARPPTARVVAEMILAAAQRHAGGQLVDDATVMVLRVVEAG